MKNVPHPKVKKVIPRTMAGLRDALFDVLERVRDQELLAEDAREMANIARVIIESVDVQMDFESQRMASEIPQHLSDMSVVPPLTNAIENKDESKS
jgi:hypothetical protein